ncbi:MAG: hypothetical protein ACI8R9_000210 [Paraglaciecola sp.]|jgi:hypothetical protein
MTIDVCSQHFADVKRPSPKRENKLPALRCLVLIYLRHHHRLQRWEDIEDFGKARPG